MSYVKKLGTGCLIVYLSQNISEENFYIVDTAKIREKYFQIF